eukprot:3172046-Prymnesium_polylepis.1
MRHCGQFCFWRGGLPLGRWGARPPWRVCQTPHKRQQPACIHLDLVAYAKPLSHQHRTRNSTHLTALMGFDGSSATACNKNVEDTGPQPHPTTQAGHCVHNITCTHTQRHVMLHNITTSRCCCERSGHHSVYRTRRKA